MTQDLNRSIDIEPSHGDDYVGREVPEPIAEAIAVLAGAEEVPRKLGAFEKLGRTDVLSPGEQSIESMLVSEESRHEVRLADRTVHTYCFLDALVLAFLEDEPIEIATRPPDAEEPIELTASSQGIQGAHEEMVVSFGFANELPTDPAAYEDEPVEEVQATIHEHGCPKINLFPDRDGYDAWAREAEAVTMPLPLAEALALARDTVETWGDQTGDGGRA